MVTALITSLKADTELPTSIPDITLQVIAAVLIGGTSLFGGIGTIAGTALGAILFAEIQNTLAVLGVNPLYQNIVIGIILAAAVSTDTWRRSRAFQLRR